MSAPEIITPLDEALSDKRFVRSWLERPFVQWHFDYQAKARELNPCVVDLVEVSRIVPPEAHDQEADLLLWFPKHTPEDLPYRAMWMKALVCRMQPVFGMEFFRISGDEYEDCLRWWYDENQCGHTAEHLLGINYEALRRACDGMGVKRMNQIARLTSELRVAKGDEPWN